MGVPHKKAAGYITEKIKKKDGFGLLLNWFIVSVIVLSVALGCMGMREKRSTRDIRMAARVVAFASAPIALVLGVSALAIYLKKHRV